MIPTMAPYTPSLYRPDGLARYRQYPHTVETPIPGAGYDVGRLEWKEQVLNLDGSASPQPYGNYAAVPLRGLGQTIPLTAMTTLRTSAALPIIKPAEPAATTAAPEQGGYVAPEVSPEEEMAEVQQLIEASQAAPVPAEPGFFQRKVGPVPVWALALGGVAVVGGGAFWMMRRKKVAKNRRRRRRRR